MDQELIHILLAVSAGFVLWNASPVFVCWARARRSGAPIGLLTLWGMYLRNVPLDDVISAYVSARKAGVPVGLPDLASHARAGGDVRAVVYAYVETVRAGTRIDFTRVCEIELEDSNSPEGE